MALMLDINCNGQVELQLCGDLLFLLLNKNKKPDQAYLPRPLRSKKNPNSLPRSRSLHASPTRENHHEPYYTDDDGRKKKKRDPNSTKPLSRSASMRDTRKTRSRPSSRPTSPPEERRSKTLPKSATQNSLEKRGQGLRMEGKVVNGDVEDPYGNSSDIEPHRSDVAAIKQEKRRPSSRASVKKEKPQHSNPSKKNEQVTKAEVLPYHRNKEYQDISPSRLSASEDSDYIDMKPKRSSSTSRRTKEKTPSKSRDSSLKRKSKKKERPESPQSSDNRHTKKSHPNGYVDEYLPTASDGNDHDYLSLDDDVPFGDYNEDELDHVPPPYPATSHSPAERNLNRIKRSDSARSNSTSSTRSKTPVAKEVESKKKEPKQESTKKKKVKDSVDGKATPKKHVEAEPEVKPKQERRKSKDSTKGKSPSKKKKHREEKKKAAEVIAEPAVVTEVPAKQSSPEHSLKTPVSEDNLLASNGTLYMPLPDKSNDETKSDQFRCNSEVQTDMSGTLPRKPKPKAVEEVPAPVTASPQHAASVSQTPKDVASPPTSTSTDPTKFVEDFCKMMLNFQNMALKNQNEKSQDSAPTQTQFPDPKVMNPFAAFYPNHQGGQHPTPPHNLYSQFPPHISYQLYMSWMAAYYAGATGSLPPPPPFSSYPSMGSDKGNLPPFDYQTFPSVFHPAYMRDGYNSSAQASPQKEPFQSYDSSMMYHSNAYNQTPQKGTENFGSESYDYPRSQSPFENLASVSVSGSEKAGQTRTRGRPTKSNKSSNSTLASGKMNTIDTLPTHNDAADTDASSITSTSTKPEIAVQSGPKGGVMVYVRSSSQSNSRANSTISGEDGGSSGDHALPPGINGDIDSHRSRDADAEDTAEDLKKKSKKGSTSSSDKKSSRRSSKASLASSDKKTKKQNGFAKDESEEENLVNGETETAPNYDYYSYTPNQDMYNSDPYNRIAEIYDFEPNFKDANIVPHFKKYKGFKLWWVDDIHALGVFSSSEDMKDAVSHDIPDMKVRPISQASSKSKKKAKLRVEDFGEKVSSESRPKTDSSVARRMIANALGGGSKSLKKNDTGSLKQKKKKSQDRRKSNTT